MDVPSSASLNITGAVTVEAWVKTTTTADQAVVERYATYPGAGVSNGGYVLRLMGGRVTFATLKNSNEFDYVQGATPVSVGVWHHVAGVFDGSQLRVYLNGVTDTLGRVINFGYDAQGYPENITQTWHREVEGGPSQPVPETHEWARFAYDNQTLDINFNQGLTALGAGDGQLVRVLKRVTMPDDSYVVFNYTTWGQVHQVSNYAKDNGLLSYVKLGLPLDAALAQGDCPRPTERRDWAAYANGDTNRVGAEEEESVTTYDVDDGVTWQNPESNLPETGRQTVVVAPDSTVYREYARTAGWSKGLVCLSEFKSGGKLKKRTSTT